ncbi:MAG: RraA family protein [Planctomycetes bacterium]|nr:RraA family protein [Planctomycetota bacterium]
MTKIHAISQSDLKLLRKFDTPTVCNVIELFDVRPRVTGYMDGRIQACYPKMPPMVGYASTATFRSAAPPRSGDIYSSMGQQVEAFRELPGPAVVVFQDLDNPPAAATFGEVMCTTYKTFGAVGIVTSGGGRDLDQVEALGFPAFVGSVICAHGYCHTLAIHVPVHVGGITVYPGDLIHGDRNGVSTIPNEIASAVAHACQDFMAAEQVVLDHLKSGSPAPKGLAEARDECQRQIAAIRERVRKRG